MSADSTGSNGLAIGRGALRQLHASLLANAPDHAIRVLQEAGYASGEGIYEAFCAWLPAAAGVKSPQDLDAGALNDVLSRFFSAKGWGTLTLTHPGGAALAADSTDWAEAEPGSAQMPMCFFSTGMLADFLGRLAGEQVAVMEVECRSKNDARCRFLSAAPDTLQQIYEQMTQGKSYEEALAG
ncbi:MAG TPA: V4R domain-containing protein [Gemmatimonadales bacterium]|nr:V4R domain-containing protein [Gemmatimonadales bacterium]